MNEKLVTELCSLIEDYKRRDAALVIELATVNAQKNDLRRDCDELLTVLRHTDVYVNEVEEAVANLDRELARVQAAYTSADEELHCLRKLLRETHPQQVNQLECELWSLRQETKRLQAVVTEKETELNEYESIIEKQQLKLSFLVTESSSVIVGRGRSPRENRHPPRIAEAMPCASQSPLLQAALLRRRELRDSQKDDSAVDKWVNNGKKHYDSILLDLDKEISSKALSDLEHRSRFLAARSRRSIGGAKAYLEKTWGEDVQIRQATPACEDELDHGWIGLGSGLHVGTRWRRRGTGSSGSSIVVPCDNDDSASSYER